MQAERLNRALGNYRLALAASSPETDRALMSRAREAAGRIHAFENTSEAAKESMRQSDSGDVPAELIKTLLKAGRS
jgi:hypothetical protein